MTVYKYKGEIIEPCECGRSIWIRRIVKGNLMLVDALSPHYRTIAAAKAAITIGAKQ